MGLQDIFLMGYNPSPQISPNTDLSPLLHFLEVYPLLSPQSTYCYSDQRIFEFDHYIKQCGDCQELYERTLPFKSVFLNQG
uniref:Uncharacterized protein n=1 Tax=Pyxicephalus adspersus TaxID=30357 RepID=A0AAV3AVL7_PYXAD|nr:TPA: hypothetical protein GDO54_007539 [Pyxicephalus adspersus]